MSRTTRQGKEAREYTVRGIDAVANIVRTTVGPCGRNVMIREQISPPIITNDGVTIAKAIQLKDNTEDAGAQLIINAANKTNEIAGDGTTTTTILTQEMIHKYNDYMEQNPDNNENAMQVRKDMIEESNKISEYLLNMSTEINDKESLQRVATISSGDEVIGKMIADAFEKAGKYGNVIVEDSNTNLDTLEVIQGMRLTNGCENSMLLNDRANLRSDVEDVSVLVCMDKIDSTQDFFTGLDGIVKAGKKLLIICDGIESEPLQNLIVNKMRGVLANIYVIGLPGFGSLREGLIDDICLATGATLIGREYGKTIREVELSDLGEIKELNITMDDTVLKFKDITSDKQTDLSVKRQERINELLVQEQNAEEKDKEQYARRISNLSDGIVVINVGGNSEVEVKDKKLRIEDALHSVESAKEEGIVPGGGYSFLSYYLDNVYDNSDTETLGQRIVHQALLSVTKQIADNAGYNGEEVVSNCLEKKLGFNALTGEYENLLDTGIINSVKVDRYSLLHATSTAANVITMSGTIVEENEKDQNVLQLQTAVPVQGIM